MADKSKRRMYSVTVLIGAILEYLKLFPKLFLLVSI